MRILQLAPIWETVPPPAYGGTETVVHALVEELVRRGHDVTLCASGDSCTSARLFSVYPRSLREAGLCDDALQYSAVHVAQSLALAGDYDIVHSHNGPPTELGMAMSQLIETPILTTLHNQLREDGRFIWSNYSGWFNTISEHQARTSPHMAQAKFAGAVYNAIDVDSFPFRAEKDDYVLFIGRLTEEKGAHLAIEAAKRAGQRIVLAGKIALEEEHRYFDEKVAPLLDGTTAEFVGEADSSLKRELYAGARALLSPLQWDEPFGLVMIEAMACGTPVIVFPRGAAPELVIDGETGLLVPDVDAMAEAIGHAGEIDPWRCREHVEEHFAPGAMADRYLELYEKILGVTDVVRDSVPA